MDSAGGDVGIDDRDDIEGNVESEMYVYDDRPFLERISPFDMFVDPDARHPKEMCWIAQRIWRPIQDVQVDEPLLARGPQEGLGQGVVTLVDRGRRRPRGRRARQGRQVVLRDHRVLRHQAQHDVHVRPRLRRRRATSPGS